MYDLLWATSPGDLPSAECVESGLSGPFPVDDELPSRLFVYVIPVRNACGSTLGTDSTGVARFAAPCP